MARKRPPLHSPGPYRAERDPSADPPWRVMAGELVLAAIHSGRPRGDAERIAAALDTVGVIPTADLQTDIVTRLWATLLDLVHLVEGGQVPEGYWPGGGKTPSREDVLALVLARTHALIDVCRGEAQPPQGT